MKQYINPTVACIDLQGENMMQQASVSTAGGGSQSDARAPQRIDYLKV